MKRVSSGKSVTTEEMKEKLLCGGYFKDILFVEAPHVERMSKERYVNTWKSVNDIQVQAGEEGFQRILSKIEDIICQDRGQSKAVNKINNDKDVCTILY